MSWNVFDQDGPHEEPRPQIEWRIDYEDKPGLTNVHRIPTNDGFDHVAKIDCPCNPTHAKQHSKVMDTGKIQFRFYHQVKGDPS